MIVFLFRGLIQRTSPTFVRSQLIGATVGQSLKFSKDSFYFAMGLYDTATNSYFGDPNIYTVDVILYLAPSFTGKLDWTEESWILSYVSLLILKRNSHMTDNFYVSVKLRLIMERLHL